MIPRKSGDATANEWLARMTTTSKLTSASAGQQFASWLASQSSNAKLGVLCHSDADGIAAGAILHRALNHCSTSSAVSHTGRTEPHPIKKAQKLSTAAPLCQTHAYSPAVFRQRLAASRKGPANASASLNNSRSLSIPAVNTMKAAVRFVGNLEAEAAEVFTLSPSFPVQIVERRRDAHAVSLASDSSQP